MPASEAEHGCCGLAGGVLCTTYAKPPGRPRGGDPPPTTQGPAPFLFDGGRGLRRRARRPAGDGATEGPAPAGARGGDTAPRGRYSKGGGARKGKRDDGGWMLTAARLQFCHAARRKRARCERPPYSSNVRWGRSIASSSLPLRDCQYVDGGGTHHTPATRGRITRRLRRRLRHAGRRLARGLRWREQVGRVRRNGCRSQAGR